MYFLEDRCSSMVPTSYSLRTISAYAPYYQTDDTKKNDFTTEPT